MRSFLGNTTLPQNGSPTRLSSTENWQQYYKEKLEIPASISQHPAWLSLSAEDYEQIYNQAKNRFHTIPYDWRKLTLLDAVLLLGKSEQLKRFLEQSSITLDKVFLNRAAQLSTLEVITFLVEEKGIRPLHDTLSEASAHNTYEIVNYISQKTGLKADLFSAVVGKNFTVATRLLQDGLETTQMFYTQVAGRNNLEMLKFLATNDKNASEHLPFATKVAYLRGAIDCLKYLVEEKGQSLSADWVNLKPSSNEEAVAGYLETQLASALVPK